MTYRELGSLMEDHSARFEDMLLTLALAAEEITNEAPLGISGGTESIDRFLRYTLAPATGALRMLRRAMEQERETFDDLVGKCYDAAKAEEERAGR